MMKLTRRSFVKKTSYTAAAVSILGVGRALADGGSSGSDYVYILECELFPEESRNGNIAPNWDYDDTSLPVSVILNDPTYVNIYKQITWRKDVKGDWFSVPGNPLIEVRKVMFISCSYLGPYYDSVRQFGKKFPYKALMSVQFQISLRKGNEVKYYDPLDEDDFGNGGIIKAEKNIKTKYRNNYNSSEGVVKKFIPSGESKFPWSEDVEGCNSTCFVSIDEESIKYDCLWAGEKFVISAGLGASIAGYGGNVSVGTTINVAELKYEAVLNNSFSVKTI